MCVVVRMCIVVFYRAEGSKPLSKFLMSFLKWMLNVTAIRTDKPALF